MFLKCLFVPCKNSKTEMQSSLLRAIGTNKLGGHTEHITERLSLKIPVSKIKCMV